MLRLCNKNTELWTIWPFRCRWRPTNFLAYRAAYLTLHHIFFTGRAPWALYRVLSTGKVPWRVFHHALSIRMASKKAFFYLFFIWGHQRGHLSPLLLNSNVYMYFCSFLHALPPQSLKQLRATTSLTLYLLTPLNTGLTFYLTAILYPSWQATLQSNPPQNFSKRNTIVSFLVR